MDPHSGTIAEIELLYRQYGAALLLLAMAMTGERGRAQEAVHHVFLKLIESGDLGRANDKKAYLFGLGYDDAFGGKAIPQKFSWLSSAPTNSIP